MIYDIWYMIYMIYQAAPCRRSTSCWGWWSWAGQWWCFFYPLVYPFFLPRSVVMYDILYKEGTTSHRELTISLSKKFGYCIQVRENWEICNNKTFSVLAGFAHLPHQSDLQNLLIGTLHRLPRASSCPHRPPLPHHHRRHRLRQARLWEEGHLLLGLHQQLHHEHWAPQGRVTHHTEQVLTIQFNPINLEKLAFVCSTTRFPQPEVGSKSSPTSFQKFIQQFLFQM